MVIWALLREIRMTKMLWKGLAMLFILGRLAEGLQLFPNNYKAISYDYSAEIGSGLDEPAPHISGFRIRGSLRLQADPAAENAYVIQLADVKHEMYNGPDVTDKETQQHPVPELASVIQDPFWAIYDDNNMLIGLKFQNTEPGWSKNMKKAIATIFQVDLSSFNFTDDFFHTAYISEENTIQGTCQISYDVHTLDQKPFSECKSILVTKVYEPAQCTNFSTRVFNHAESFGCYIKREKDLITSVTKKLQFEKYGNFLYLDRFRAREMFYYFPWMASTEVHHVQISQSLQNFQLTDKYSISKIDFQSAPLTSDVAYEKPLVDISVNATEDMTQGRHEVNQSELVLHVHDLIFEAADYLEENHLDPSQPDFKHGQVINRLLTNMANLNLSFMDQIFNVIQDAKSMREETARKIFLEMMPHVGTAASCLFIRNAVIHRKYNLSESALVSMIHKFPSYVRRPTEQLLLEMEQFLQMDNVPKASVIQSKEIRKAAILSFASLVYKTFKEQASEDNPFLLEMYLQHINRTILDLGDDTNYEMKLVHIMALRNIQIGSIERFLIPLINGDVTMDENTRLAASFAAAQAINPDKELVHNLFWPILTDSSNSVRLRIVAYDVLMSQLPDAKRAMNIHWFMENDQNEQLFNYHYTTIKSLAGLEDPCLGPLKALAKKILRLTKTRKVREPLSGSYVLNYVDSKYDYGETFKLALSIDDKSGLPSMGIFEYYFSIGKRASPVKGIYWNTNTVNPLLNLLKHVIVKKTMISNETIQEILRQTRGYQLKMLEPLHFEMCYILHGRIVQVISVDKNDLNQESFIAKMKSVLQLLSNFERRNFSINWQKLMYSNLYEMIVTSDIGIPVIFCNRQPSVSSNRLKIEFAALKSISNLILQSDNRLWIYDTYEMVVYNPIIDVFHSIQRISALDLVYPIKVELKYDLERQNLNCRLFRSPDTKSKGMRFYASSLVTISNDKNNVLKEYCPSCRHYEVVLGDTRNLMNYQKTLILKDIGVNYSHKIFDCEKESNSFISNEEWYRIIINEGTEFRNYPLYKFFVAVFHKRFNSLISPTSGTCGSLITVTEDINNVSYVEINFSWAKKNSNTTLNVETANLRISTNVVSTSNKSSMYFWDFNITSDARNNVDLYFIRKSLESKNLIGCIHFEKSNVSLTMNVDLSESDKCSFGENLINATVKSEVLEKHKQSNHEINLRSSTDVRFPLDSENFYDPLPTSRICLSKDVKNKSFRRFDINILYKKIPILSETVLLLKDTIRLLFLSKVKYRGNLTDAGNIKLSLIESPTTEEINAIISTPFSAFEIALPIKFLTFDEQSEQTNTSENVCHISPGMILRNNEHTFKNLSDWTLISGDYIYFTYAVFAKVDQNNNMKMELYHASHVLQIESVNNILKISFDGDLITNYRNEIALPLPEEFVSLVLRYHIEEESTQIQLIHIPIIISYAKKSLKITVISSFYGSIEGLCTNARTR